MKTKLEKLRIKKEDFDENQMPQIYLALELGLTLSK